MSYIANSPICTFLPGILFTSTPTNILYQPLPAFPRSHRRKKNGGEKGMNHFSRTDNSHYSGMHFSLFTFVWTTIICESTPVYAFQGFLKNLKKKQPSAQYSFQFTGCWPAKKNVENIVKRKKKRKILSLSLCREYPRHRLKRRIYILYPNIRLLRTVLCVYFVPDKHIIMTFMNGDRGHMSNSVWVIDLIHSHTMTHFDAPGKQAF